MIEIKNISKIYKTCSSQENIHALENITLTVPQGKIFGILGKSGAGKSTLLRCVNLLEQPTTGEIWVNQINLARLSPNKLREQRRKIGMIFQHFNLLESRNIFNNIALPLEIAGKSSSEIFQKTTELLTLVGLTDKKDAFPSQLSGGQKQRAAIARALATEPEVLLSDEATSALDTASTKSILDLLKKINQNLGLTILLITHELEVIKHICDTAAVLDKGKIIEQGSAIDLLINPAMPITKKLVQKSLNFLKINQKNPQSLFLKLIFIGKDADIPLISLLIKNFDITINIHQAQIEQIQSSKVGFTLCELTGNPERLKQALAYIQSTSIKAEVL